MLVIFSLIFVTDIKIIYVCKFVSPLTSYEINVAMTRKYIYYEVCPHLQPPFSHLKVRINWAPPCTVIIVTSSDSLFQKTRLENTQLTNYIIITYF